MNKFVAIIAMIVILFGWCAHPISVEDHNHNLIQYYDKLTKIAVENGLTMAQEGKGTYDHPWVIKVAPEEEIEVYIEHDSEDGSSGLESVDISYWIPSKSSPEGFNVKLFTQIINAISGKPLSEVKCNDFLGDSSGKYIDYTGESDDKRMPLNFFEDWVVYYAEHEYNNEAGLHFWGPTWGSMIGR